MQKNHPLSMKPSSLKSDGLILQEVNDGLSFLRVYLPPWTVSSSRLGNFSLYFPSAQTYLAIKGCSLNTYNVDLNRIG